MIKRTNSGRMNIVNFQEALVAKKAEDQQIKLNEIWEQAVNAGAISTPSSADLLFALQLRDAIMANAKARDMILAGPYNPVTTICKFAYRCDMTILNQCMDGAGFNELVETLACEISEPVGYIHSVLIITDFNKTWCAFALRFHQTVNKSGTPSFILAD